MDSKTKGFGIAAIVCLCLAITMLSNIPSWLKYKNNEISNLNSETLVLNKGDLIEGDVDMALGAAVEEYSTTAGVRTSKESSKLYYVIWLDNNKFALFETGNKEHYDKLQKITDETYAYFDSQDKYEESGDINDLVTPQTKLHITGRVVNMPSDVKKYFVEWYDQGINDGQFDSRTEAVMITNASFDRFAVIVLVGVIAAVGTVLCGILTLIFWRKNKETSDFGY